MQDIFDTKYGKFAVTAGAGPKFLHWFKSGIFHQESDVLLLKHFITKESSVIDVGAYIGTMSIPFAKYAKHVYSFEPVPATRELLEKNVVLNNLDNVTVYPFALGSGDEERFAHVEKGEDTAQYTMRSEKKAEADIEISVRTLDELVQSADLMKIDAEGMEYQVLEGGKKLLELSKPVLFCEINFGQLWAHGSSPTMLEHLLRAFNYQLYVPLGENKIGRVPSLAMYTGLLRPAFFFRIPRNYAFDVLALPGQIPEGILVVSGLHTLMRALQNQIALRFRRLWS